MALGNGGNGGSGGNGEYSTRDNRVATAPTEHLANREPTEVTAPTVNATVESR